MYVNVTRSKSALRLAHAKFFQTSSTLLFARGYSLHFRYFGNLFLIKPAICIFKGRFGGEICYRKAYKPAICVRKVEIVFVTVYSLRIRQPSTKSSETLAFYSFSRYITILYYLNDVEEGGETAFPVADNETFDQKVI